MYAFDSGRRVCTFAERLFLVGPIGTKWHPDPKPRGEPAEHGGDIHQYFSSRLARQNCLKNVLLVLRPLYLFVHVQIAEILAQ